MSPVKKRLGNMNPGPIARSSELSEPFLPLHARLGKDIMHHPIRNAETPLYDQVKEKLGWDPVAGDIPPHQWTPARRKQFKESKK